MPLSFMRSDATLISSALAISWVVRMSTVEMSKTSSVGTIGRSEEEPWGFNELPCLWAALSEPAAVLEEEGVASFGSTSLVSRVGGRLPGLACGGEVVVVVVGCAERCPLGPPFPQGALVRPLPLVTQSLKMWSARKAHILSG